jgi:hypothetical protein
MAATMSAMEYLSGTGEVIEFLNNGHLNCHACGQYWCEHINKSIVENEDSKVLFFKPDNAALGSVDVEVPMMPTSNQWAHVTLEPAQDFPGLAFEVILPETDARNSDGELHMLGYLHPGEGRYVIRSMIYDWFRGEVPLETLKCSSRSHKFMQQMRWEQDMADEHKQVAQLWSVWTTGSCLACSFNTDGLDDLIPDYDRRMPGT